MPLIAAVIKISPETDCFKVCFGLEKDFLSVHIHGICGAETEIFGNILQILCNEGAGGATQRAASRLRQ